MQPTIYSASAHHIRRKSIDHEALLVMMRLLRHGFLSYLVGGSVRDLLMGHTPKDFDISTSARPEEIKRLFRNSLLIGRRFRLAHIRFGPKVLEVATFRAGDTNESNLIVRDNLWGTPEEDVLRRDFTLNGLFYNPADDTIIDYVGGYRDLTKRLLRTIGNPEVRFKQDPVRMIRLLKFRARYGFATDEETWSALENCRGEIQKSAPARVLEELFKMLESGASASFFHLLTHCGMMEYLLPLLSRFLKEERGAVTYAHLEALDRLIRRNKRETPSRSVLMAVLLHPYISASLRRRSMAEIGQVVSLTHEALHELFTGYFASFPKRLLATVTFILNTQHRLSPLEEKRPHRSRLVHHPEFREALQLLRIRSLVDTTLEPSYLYWKEEAWQQSSPRRMKREASPGEVVETF